MRKAFRTRFSSLVGMSSLADYFDIRKSFPFYGSYHNDKRNQLVHIAFVPVIFTTALTFGSFAAIPSLGSFADAAALFYAVSFIKMEA